MAKTAHGMLSIEFANPEAVKALNRALLANFYGVTKWEMPPDYLCPPVPGRADHIHVIADLLASANGGKVPLGKAVRVLDVGVGANCIYPIIGHFEYGWTFVGTDNDPVALTSAEKIVRANKSLADAVELRLQKSTSNVFRGLVTSADDFNVTICNPPFHASLEEAQEGSRRKWKNLKKGDNRSQKPVLNFGGKSTELWCPGGEIGFIRRMIEESAGFSKNCAWFSTLVSKEVNLPPIYAALERAKVKDYRTLDMAQGQKTSRIVAWTFREPTGAVRPSN